MQRAPLEDLLELRHGPAGERDAHAQRGTERRKALTEYVIVTFPTDRIVYIDGEKNGQTNAVLELNAGTHTFDLGPHANYRPGSRKVVVEDTTPLEPREIAFYRDDE